MEREQKRKQGTSEQATATVSAREEGAQMVVREVERSGGI